MADEAEEKRSYKIGEVCRIADVQPYVLRYWETEFPQLAPSKSGGGQRVYSQREVDTILRIKQLLYSEGFTIAGAKKKLDSDVTDEAPAAVTAEAANARPSKPNKKMKRIVSQIREELSDILEMLAR